MDTNKSSILETMEQVSQFAGNLAGNLVVCGKEIADCAVNLAAAKPEPQPKPLSKVAESKKSQAKKKIDEIEKKRATSKRVKFKEKTEKSKPSSVAKTKAAEKTKIIITLQKHRSPVTKKKKSNIKTSGLTAKN